MNTEGKEIYYVKNTSSGSFVDVTTAFDGVRVLKVDGLSGKGEPVNVFSQQWVNSQVEDFCITTEVNGVPKVIRKNVDIEVTFIVRQKYATNTIDVETVHDNFVDFMTDSDVWIKSAYSGNKSVHCICQKEYKPTTKKLNRGDNSYMMGTITLHTLDKPSV